MKMLGVDFQNVKVLGVDFQNVKMLELMMPALQVVQQMYYSSMVQQAEVGPMHTMESAPDGSGGSQQQSGGQQGAKDSGVKKSSEESQGEQDKDLTATILSREEEKRYCNKQHYSCGYVSHMGCSALNGQTTCLVVFFHSIGFKSSHDYVSSRERGKRRASHTLV